MVNRHTHTLHFCNFTCSLPHSLYFIQNVENSTDGPIIKHYPWMVPLLVMSPCGAPPTLLVAFMWLVYVCGYCLDFCLFQEMLTPNRLTNWVPYSPNPSTVVRVMTCIPSLSAWWPCTLYCKLVWIGFLKLSLIFHCCGSPPRSLNVSVGSWHFMILVSCFCGR